MNNPPNGPVKWGEILQDFLFYIFSVLGYSRKKTEECWENTVLEKTVEILVLLLYPFQTKQSFTSALGTVLRPKTKNLGNSTRFVLDHPWKVPVAFN